MPTQTINQAINRILSINGDLKEEELSSLLIASGWDKNDITIGMDCYHALARAIVVSQEILPAVHSPIEIVEKPIDVLPATLGQIQNVTNKIFNPENNFKDSDTDEISAKSLDFVSKLETTSDIEKSKYNRYVIINVAILIVLLIILAVYVLRINFIYA